MDLLHWLLLALAFFTGYVIGNASGFQSGSQSKLNWRDEEDKE